MKKKLRDSIDDVKSRKDGTIMADDKSTWAVGGGLLMGVGIGFFFLQESVLAFVGSIIGGLGLGLLVTSVLWAVKRGQ